MKQTDELLGWLLPHNPSCDEDKTIKLKAIKVLQYFNTSNIDRKNVLLIRLQKRHDNGIYLDLVYCLMSAIFVCYEVFPSKW